MGSMTDPTTRQSTPAASGRIAQQTPVAAVIPQAFDTDDLPSIAFTYQLAIDRQSHTLAYYNENGAWQGITSNIDRQSFYGPVEPASTDLDAGDRWFNTSTGLWSI